MAVSKVIYDGNTLVDLTQDTVTADTLLVGATAHGADGEEVVGSLVNTHSALVPVAEATFSGVIGTANSQSGATFWLGTITPDAWLTPWHIRYELEISTGGLSNGNGIYFGSVELWGVAGSRIAYGNWNNHYSTSYRAIFYHSIACVKTEALVTAGNGHLFGLSMASSYNPTTTANAREITVRVMEANNCTVAMLDEATAYATGWNSTTWNTVTQTDAAINGLQEYGDANHTDRFYLQTTTSKADSTRSLYGTQLVLSSDGGATWHSICSNRVTTTSSALGSGGFHPDFIAYYNSSSTVSASGTIAASTLFYSIPFDFRYSIPTATCTTMSPAYLVCTYDEDDGLLYPVSGSWIAYALPTTDDGYIYVYLGHTYSTTSLNLVANHPMFKYDEQSGCAIRVSMDTAKYSMLDIAADASAAYSNSATALQAATAATSSVAECVTAAGSGLTKSGNTLNHTASVTAGTAGTSSATSGATIAVPYVTYNATGHVTASGTHTHTIGSLAASAITSGTLAAARIPTATTSAIGGVKVDGDTIVINDGVISANGSGSGSTLTTNSGGTTWATCLTGPSSGWGWREEKFSDGRLVLWVWDWFTIAGQVMGNKTIALPMAATTFKSGTVPNVTVYPRTSGTVVVHTGINAMTQHTSSANGSITIYCYANGSTASSLKAFINVKLEGFWQ